MTPKIYHIVNTNGGFVELNEAKEVLGIELNDLLYNSIKTAIPRTWKNIIKRDIHKSEYSVTNGCMPHINQNNQLIPLIKLKNRQIYNKLITKKSNPPTSINTWINLFPFLESLEWKTIYISNHKITDEPYLQSFNYKILNRIINCKDRLHRWGLSPDNVCAYCPLVDTIEHHFFECAYSKDMWTKLSVWLKSNHDITHNYTLCEVLLGIPTSYFKDIITHNIVNYTALFLKWFINQKRTQNEKLYFIDYLSKLRNKIIATTYIQLQEIQPDQLDNGDWKIHLLDSL